MCSRIKIKIKLFQIGIEVIMNDHDFVDNPDEGYFNGGIWQFQVDTDEAVRDML